MKSSRKVSSPLYVGFAHGGEHLVFGVFGRDFQLTGDMVAYQLSQVGQAVFLVGENQVVADARSDGNFFDIFDASQLLQQVDQGAVVDFQAGTNLGEETAFVAAGAF